jgi:transcriptional regulator GlxA family with amidase domain
LRIISTRPPGVSSSILIGSPGGDPGLNHYRVEYAKKLIEENNQVTNEEVAELYGFSSINSLYRAFKSFENKSLGELRNFRNSL